MVGTRKGSLEGSRAVEWCPSPEGSRQGVHQTLWLQELYFHTVPEDQNSEWHGAVTMEPGLKLRTALKISNIVLRRSPAKHELDGFDETNLHSLHGSGKQVKLFGPLAGIRQGHGRIITPNLEPHDAPHISKSVASLRKRTCFWATICPAHLPCSTRFQAEGSMEPTDISLNVLSGSHLSLL